MLKKTDVSWAYSNFVDKNFCLFYYNDEFYRAPLPTAAEWVKSPTCFQFLKSMAKKNFTPEIFETEIEVEGLSKIFKQETDFFWVKPSFSSPQMLKDAALLYLNFNKWLAKRNFALIDGHAFNIIFQGTCIPKWCDIGSIIPLTDNNQLVAIDQFIRFFIYPLLLRQKSPSLGSLMRFFVSSTGVEHETASVLEILKEPFELCGNRENILDRLIEYVESISFMYTSTVWSEYHDGLTQNYEYEYPSRIRVFEHIINALKPKTVVDIGANAGAFSRRLALMGAEVLALDPDETAVEKHYAFLRQHNLNLPIKLMVANVGADINRPGELAVALALTHHLFISQGYSWHLIAKQLAYYTSKHLLTEYMPNALYCDKKPDKLPDGYEMDLFVEELLKYFKEVEVIDYDVPAGQSPRIFLLCKNKKDSPVISGL